MRLSSALSSSTTKSAPAINGSGRLCCSVAVVRGGVEPPTFRFSGGRSYRLSYLTSVVNRTPTRAVLTGLEPATSTLTGWRALQTALQDLASGIFVPAVLASLSLPVFRRSSTCRFPGEPWLGRAPNGIRTRVAALKGRCPRPLDDGGSRLASRSVAVFRWRPLKHRGLLP